MPIFRILIILSFALTVSCSEQGHRQSATSKPQNINGSHNSDGTESPEQFPECVASKDALEEDGESPFFKPNVIEPVKALDPVLGNIPGRTTQSLNGSFSYIVDQLGIGDASPLLRGGIGENQQYGSSELLEYDFNDNHVLEVPGDWNSQHAELFWYRGIVWYQRYFEHELKNDKRVFIYFGGANFNKDVYLNGHLIARHKGGFTPFNSDVSDYIKQGRNDLVVKVDSMSGPADIPTQYNDWMNYGGLTRDVSLVETDVNHITNYKVQLAKGSFTNIAGWVQLNISAPQQTHDLSLSIPELGVHKKLQIDSKGRAEFEISAKPQLWQPQAPKLYAVEINYNGRVLADKIGFRSISTQGKDLLLNGEKIYLRGISTHEESLLRHGRAFSRDDANALVATLKELNANFVRLAHYPHNEHIVRAADEAGLLIWAEIPVYHNIDFADPCTLASAQQQYSELIARDQNRASVIFWSLGNETQDSPARNSFFARLAAHVRQLDDTRLLSAALLGFGGLEAIGKYLGTKLAAQNNALIDLVTDPQPVTISIEDPLGNTVDVLGYNEYLGWYMSGFLAQKMRENGLNVTEAQVRDLMLNEMQDIGIESSFDKPIIISEFGAGAKHGKRGGELDVWSEDYQARVYRQQLKMLNNSSAIRGISPWILKDFRAPYRLNNEIQQYWNRKGLLSETGEKKLAFSVLSDHYKALKEKSNLNPVSD